MVEKISRIVEHESEITLDPEDWDKMRCLSHQMIDDIMTYLQNLREKPIFQPFNDETIAHFKLPAPLKPQGPEKAYQDFQKYVLNTNNTTTIHPRYWGQVAGNGTPMGMLGEMLSAGLNQCVENDLQICYHVEMQVLNWLKEMLRYPKNSSGLLVTGASAANLIGIAVARNSKAGFNIRKSGLQNADNKMTLYGSTEMHSSLQKAVEILGFGDESLRRIKTDKAYRIDLAELKKFITADREVGLHPICVIGNAGTVNVGAFDDLNALSNICAKENMWLHVDGAFGAFAALSPKLRYLVDGMDRADSLAFDLHKWMSVPYGIGCIFVKRLEDHLRTFSLSPAYLKDAQGKSIWLPDLGFELSRTPLALKAWMPIKENGVDKYAALVEQNVDQARYFAELVKSRPELELLAPVYFNIVCFRYVIGGLGEKSLAELNSKLAWDLIFSGDGAAPTTVIDGKTSLRVCITNHRVKRRDFEDFIEKLVEKGDELTKTYLKK